MAIGNKYCPENELMTNEETAPKIILKLPTNAEARPAFRVNG